MLTNKNHISPYRHADRNIGVSVQDTSSVALGRITNTREGEDRDCTFRRVLQQDLAS
jgi:hypothetical protein